MFCREFVADGFMRFFVLIFFLARSALVLIFTLFACLWQQMTIESDMAVGKVCLGGMVKTKKNRMKASFPRQHKHMSGGGPGLGFG